MSYLILQRVDDKGDPAIPLEFFVYDSEGTQVFGPGSLGGAVGKKKELECSDEQSHSARNFRP